MTKLLEKAFTKASTELDDRQQDDLAKVLLENLNDMDEVKWDLSFAGSQETLATLADEAEEEVKAGKTQPLESLFR